MCCSSELVDDVVDATDGDGILVTVRRSKTNQEGEVNDVRFVKDGVARALRTLRAATTPEPGDRVVPLSAQMIGLRFTAAAMVAGVESRVTAHSGRGGLASELTSRGASIFPETSLPLDLPGQRGSGIEVGALIIAVDVNQPAAEFEDGFRRARHVRSADQVRAALEARGGRSCDAPGAPGGRAAGVQPDTWEHRSMTWQCRRCGRTVDLVLRDGDRCAACAMRTRAGRTLPADDGAADPPVDGWDVSRMRKLLLQPSSSSAGDAGAQDAIGEAIHAPGGDLGDAAS